MKKLLTLLWLTITAFTFKATAQGTTCNAEFSTQYLTNFTVKFNPVITEGAPLVHHYWNFGDGSTGNQQVSPTHTYAATGTYAVVHTIVRVNQNNAPVCTQTFTKFVHITAACNLVVDFSSTATSTNPLMIAFQNLSVPLASTDSITWNFGDNTTSSAVNPVHTYANAGTYTVCLRVKKNNNQTSAPCVREICKTIVVHAPCNLVANFSWTVASTNSLMITFQNLSVPLSNTDSIKWTFGDGATSTAINPTHTYNVPGTYTVCLRIKKLTPPGAPPCIREICKIVVVQQTCNLVANFTSQPDATNPLRIKFTNTSTPIHPTDSLKWTFGDGSSLSGVQSDPAVANPIHTYANAGTYTVCLRVKKNGNLGSTVSCVREICRPVVVTPPCNMVVDFNWTVNPNNPLIISFHNLTTPIATNDSIRWTFGDGTTSNAVNPVHTYTAPGTYTVCLKVIRYNSSNTTPCIREICKTVVVTQPCNLVVDFNWTVNPNNPLIISFHNLTNTIAATDSIRWTFGDGTTSNAIHPVHTYTAPGTYTVCLRVIRYYSNTTAPCIREICKTVVVTQPCTLVVNFTSQPDANNPLRIKFTNTSTPIHPTDSLRWIFGDGTSLSGVQSDPAVANPIHTYTSAGVYVVCLRVKKNNNTTAASFCIREKCNTIVIPVPCNLVVNFTSQPDPNHPLRIKFTNTSTPINPSDSLRWTFGDGTSLSGVQSDPNVAAPTHNYTTAGTYTVCLMVKKNNNSTPPSICVRDKCNTIVVTPPCNFPVNFSWRLDSANIRKVYFTNLSTPPTATAFAVWTFGDGSSATSWNAIHEYAQPGSYIVCLKIYLSQNSNCVREFCDTVIIPHTVPPCTQLSKYTYQVFSNDNQKYRFTPDYINTTLQYTWTFGDGTGSHDPIAIHRYAQPGVYTACLTVWRGPDCASTTCKTITVLPQVICDTAQVWYNYQSDPQIPNKIHFYANATMPIVDQLWVITRLNGTVTTPPVILHQNNPVYTFQDTGWYRVCLKATLLGGCVKEYCSNIHIQQISNACLLQAFPNPASVTVNVNVNLTQPEMIHGFVYNSQNVLVLTKQQQGTTGNNLMSFDVHNLPAGQYTIKLVYGNRVCYAIFQKL